MRRLLRVGAAALLIAGGASAAPVDDPTGVWWAEGGSARVEITRCGDALCGQVVWLRSPFDPSGCPLRDENNPNVRLRDREVLGTEILRNLRSAPDKEGVWEGGEIYDPGSGRTYRATLVMDGSDRLRLRGYVGIRLLGRTVTWIRVGTEGQCRGPAGSPRAASGD
jgi:uncharacterized protein (DUF2147 family)